MPLCSVSEGEDYVQRIFPVGTDTRISLLGCLKTKAKSSRALKSLLLARSDLVRRSRHRVCHQYNVERVG